MLAGAKSPAASLALVKQRESVFLPTLAVACAGHDSNSVRWKKDSVVTSSLGRYAGEEWIGFEMEMAD